jgi:hypothetical protein
LPSSRKPFFFLLLLLTLITAALAEGTRLWEQSRFDELTKGTATGVAIRSTGGLELAPTFKSLYATPSTYIWSIAADDSGNAYIAAGAPARVYRITPEGKATIIFEPKELQVQTLRPGPGGIIYAATAPDGKVYKLEHNGGGKSQPSKAASDNEKKDKNKDDKNKNDKDKDASDAAKPSVDPSWTSSIYFEPDRKYIWDLALDKSGNLFVATGDHGEIYKVTPKGDHSVFFKSDETHIRVLAFDPQQNLIAGSDGSGLIYRISPSGEGFVLYSAPKKEITALALDKAGNIYAAAVGEKRSSSSSSSTAALLNLSSSAPASSTPQVPGMTITPPPTSTPSTPFPFPGGVSASGSDVYRISPDGAPTRLWSSREDIVYALAFDSQGRLLAGTGNRGHIFAITGLDDFSDLLKSPASQVTGFAPAPGGGLYAATSNLGKVFILGPGPEAEGTYQSDVFDAKIFSRWGHAEFRGAGKVDLYARSGNVDNPDRNWSAWKKIELTTGDITNNGETGIPPARYAQWKAVLHSGSPAPRVDSIALNYLPKNTAPEIDDVTVQVGVKYQTLPKSSTTSTSDASSTTAHFEMPTPSSHDRDSIGVKWSAHDENDDQLVYSIYYRGDGDSRWLLLKDNLTDKAYSFDASLLPDGGYTVKVVASDAPSHSPGEELTASRESRRFEVDTTPPRIENLSASLAGDQIRITFRTIDGFSPIKRAEYSVDASDWKYVEPVGQISDSKTENYDFKVSLEKVSLETEKAVPSGTGSPNAAASSEHVVVVRVYDRYENMAAAKTILRPR